jgi:hypothetical protein
LKNTKRGPICASYIKVADKRVSRRERFAESVSSNQHSSLSSYLVCYLNSKNCSLIIRAVESASAIVTRSSKALDVFSQSLERAYFEASEGAEDLVDHQVHFSVSQLKTGDTTACEWEPELHELPSKAFQAQLLH